MRKDRRKISGGFCTAPEVQDLAIVHIVLSSARKQNRNRLKALLQGREALFPVLSLPNGWSTAACLGSLRVAAIPFPSDSLGPVSEPTWAATI